MSDVHRGHAYGGPRSYRDRDSDSDDDRYRSTTVTRYKVNPGRGSERFDRSERVEADDDRRSRFSARTSGDFLDERRGPLSPSDRPRSAFEPAGDRSRTVYYERDVERDARREPDRSRVAVFDGDRDWDRRSHHTRHDDEIKVEKKFEERFDDDHGHEVERYRKETEYYSQADPPPAPVIIRQQVPEPQKIIVQEAPPPAPIVLPRQQPGVVVVRDREQDREMVRRERDPYDEEYYYRHERRDIGPYRGDHDYSVSRYERRRRDDDYYSGDDDYYVRRTVVRRERSSSPHHQHKLQLAEGALAGAGISALMSSRRDEYGDLPENRGRKVIAGAALGALGTEAIRRAHSAYEDRWGDGRESPDHHSRLKKGLGIAAVALAAAGAAKYYQSSKVEKEEAHRGRSRTRGGYHSDEEEYYSRSVSRTRSKSKSRRRSISTVAKAALGTAATAGIIKHFRDKSKSKSRSRHGSRSRSKSKLRRGAEIAGVAAAAGVANKLWKNHKEKKEASRERSRARSFSDDERDYRRRSRSRGYSRDRGMSRSRSRSRSMARSPYSPTGADPELGLIEYGRDPLPPSQRSASRGGYESGGDDGRRRRRRRRDPSVSSSPSDQERKRSRSRLRNMAAAGATAFGIKEFKDRKDQEKREQRSRERRSRERDDARRRYDEDERRRRDDYADDRHGHRSQSPPTASGGAYYPPYPSTPGPAAGGGPNYAPYPDAAGNPPREYQPYMPQDYMGYVPPPPPGPPPAPEPGLGGTYPSQGPPGPPPSGPPGPPGPPPPPAGPPPPSGNYPPDHVSDLSRDRGNPAWHAGEGALSRAFRAINGDGGSVADTRIDGMRPDHPYAASSPRDPPTASKSVSFIPLSPKSSKTMERHKKGQAASADASSDDADEHDADDGDEETTARPSLRRRRSSDPSSDRPIVRRGHGRDADADNDVEDLPDRFDSQGRPLNGRSATHARWTTRQGTFERPAQRPGGWDVRGAWQVSGTEQEAVDRLVRNVTGALGGQRSWMSVIGEVIGGGLLPPAGGGAPHDGERKDRDHDGNTDEGRRRRRGK
ncbi:hypothetical protein JDV02_007226 [Purpureocillium takamizusanense]|uniref:DUF3824 domain-containing protein n=1 Tax=Purpureocillium takamizusanense TaxID=2060973 RepID=A0A9Q8VDJ0_9HYPO|nr:uncharacterized protein JDV02_007226 [Purpureocillium takamizusanense]UNI21216.1 hypothetical protein JDV02_007226 [Purpureocillium takamizusanense]